MAPRAGDELTRILHASDLDERTRSHRVFTLVYDELRRLARQQRRALPRSTVETTALVHEAYLRLSSSKNDWQSRQHFYAVAAKAMRSVLIDAVRSRRRQKRTGGPEELIRRFAVQAEARSFDLLSLDEGLGRLKEVDPVAERLIELRFFAGLGVAEAGAMLGLSERTARRKWHLARAWLRREVHADG